MTNPRTHSALRLSRALQHKSLWKIYRLLPDPDAATHQQLRVVDESGEDYLFPESCFKAVELSAALVRLYGRGGRGTGGRAAIKTA
jgi:hypothetical protein